jgi:PAS domain S-box-containing protein
MLDFLRKLFGGRSGTGPAGEESLRAAVAGQGRAESSLRESEEHFGQLVSGVRDYAVFLLDRQGNVQTWNAGAERIKGYRAEDIIGQHFSRFYPKEAVTSGWPAHELSVASVTGRFEDEGWRVRKDGSRFWANVVITALKDEAGEVRGFLKITRDLTDRKQAEEKLRLSEERFRLMVESVKDYAIFMLDPQGRVATWNAGAERIKGYTADDIIGQHFSKFYPKEAVERGWPDEELRRAAADGRVEDEGWRVRKDGSRFWANVVITALRDESGALRGFGKVTRDLTERRRAEEQARRLAQEEAARKAAEEAALEIERQREQLHVTLQSIGDAVIVTDARGEVTFLNPVAAGLTGWGADEAAGRPLEQVFRIVNEQTRRAVENPVDKVFREKRVVELANHTALVARDGREVPVEDSAAPIRGRGGDIGGAVLVFRDVTEARRAAEARQHLAAIVESSDDAIIGQTLDGRITSWNRGAKRLYGYTADEVIGKPLSILAPPDHADEIPTITERIRRGETVEHFEAQRVRKDGSRMEVSLTISPIRDAEGEVAGASRVARDITERKRAAEALREEVRTTETLRRIGLALAGELDLHKLVQTVTDEATRLSDAQFGAFFYNVVGERGEAYTLYTLSGVPREAFDRFPMPRNTAVFDPTFKGEATVRLDDVTQDPRFGKNAPYHGMPEGHLPVRSYLAVPVKSRAGEVLGGLFFGHPQAGVFSERDERLVEGIAAQAAVAIDNARLFEAVQRQRLRAERGEQVSRFLADASVTLASLVDYESTLQKIAKLAVPRFADWAAVDMAEDGGLRRLAVAHADPAKVELALELGRRYPPDPDSPHGAYHVLRTGQPEMMTDIPEEVLARQARDEDHLRLLRELGLVSYICVPLTVRGKTLGVLTFASAESSRH